MTDAKTQRLMDELVTLRRENLALRLEVTQLRDCLRQRDGAPQGGMGIAPVLRAANGRLGGAAGEPGAWPKACPQCGAQVPDDYFHFVHWRSTWPDSRYCLQGHLLMRSVSLGYADFDCSIAKAGSEDRSTDS